MGVHAALVFTAFAGATSLEYVSLEVLNIAFNQKNPRKQSETLIWLSTAIKQFGLKIQVKEVIEYTKKAFSSSNAVVRTAALALVGTMYMYLGKSLRSFFENEKPALLQQIDAEFDKMKDVVPPAPVKGKVAKTNESGDGSEYENCAGRLNLENLLPRVDISNQNTKNELTKPASTPIDSLSPLQVCSDNKSKSKLKLCSKPAALVPDNCLSLLEERIKTKIKSRKTADPSIAPSIPKTSPAACLNESKDSDESEPKFQQSTVSASGPLRFNTDDIKQMFKHREPAALVPGFVHVDVDEILNLPDIQLPQSRLRPPATSLKLFNNSAEIETAVNLVMAQLTAPDIPVVKEAFAQVEEILKQHYLAIKVLGSRVDQLLTMGALQYRYTHNKHMADENICKTEVVSLYRCVSMALVTLFDNPVLAKNASRDVLKDLIPHLISIMLDSRLEDLQEGDKVVKVINLLIMRILQKSNQTHVLSALIKLLHDCVGSVTVSEPFTDVVMKCLWKMIRATPYITSELNVDRILLDIHVFLKAFPSLSWRKKQCDTPLRTIKTILFKLVEIKNEDIMKHLSLITDCQDSDLVRYLHKILVRKNLDYRESMSKNTTLDDNTAINNFTQSTVFPSLPPCTLDTTPVDLVEWLKSFVAQLGMDTSKYDSPAFLDKTTGSGNDGPLSKEEMSKMLHDIERYKKLLNNMKNSMRSTEHLLKKFEVSRN